MRPRLQAANAAPIIGRNVLYNIHLRIVLSVIFRIFAV